MRLRIERFFGNTHPHTHKHTAFECLGSGRFSNMENEMKNIVE